MSDLPRPPWACPPRYEVFTGGVPVDPATLPSDLTLHLTNWALNLALKGGRTVEEARSVEAVAWAQLGERRSA
jgi:hypothetical protein